MVLQQFEIPNFPDEHQEFLVLNHYCEYVFTNMYLFEEAVTNIRMPLENPGIDPITLERYSGYNGNNISKYFSKLLSVKIQRM